MSTKTTTDAPSEAPAGTVGKLKRLKADSAHSLAEVQEFLAQLRGRSPQEVLGIVSASNLVKAVLQATVGCLLLILVFTVGPYYLSGAKTAAPTKSNAKADSAAEAPAETTPVATTAFETPADATTDPDPAKAAKALNIDEAKPADPNVNPLDKDIDKLLDGK